MTAQGIVLNLTQISFQIHAQQASSDPVMKNQMGGKAEQESRKQIFTGKKKKKHDTDTYSWKDIWA